MAELGVISGSLGIVSLAFQVSDSVMKLKSFLDNVKNAPNEINYTISQIEALDMVLSSADVHEYDDDSFEATAVAMQNSKLFLVQAAGALEASVKDLHLAIGKGKKVGSFKAALKQTVIEKLKQKLRDAQDLLVLSNQYFSQALQRRRHDMQREWAEIQVSKLNHLEVQVKQCKMAIRFIPPDPSVLDFSNMEKRVSKSDELAPNNGNATGAKDDCQGLARSLNRVTSSITRQKRILARLKLPFWLRLTSLCLEIRGERSIYGMSLDLKAYRNVDYDAPIMKYAREGNVQAIQEMFSKGAATPHDRNEIHGTVRTVLSVAAQSGQIEVCRLLIEQGAHQHARDAYFVVQNSRNPLQKLESGIEMIRTLAGAVQDDDFFDLHPKKSAISCFRGESTLLSWILNNLIGYNYQKATIRDRTRLAIRLCARTGQPRAASLVRLLLQEPHAISQMYQYKDSRSRTLLSSAAWAFGEQSFRATQSARMRGRDLWAPSFNYGFKLDAHTEFSCRQDLLFLMKELVLAGADLHSCVGRFRRSIPRDPGETPLGCIFVSFGHQKHRWMFYLQALSYSSDEEVRFTLPPEIAEVFEPVMIWLEMLYDSEVDLVKYGRKEKELRQAGRTTSHCWFDVWPRNSQQPPIVSFMALKRMFWIGFTYGPKPSDWQFWLIEEMDDWFAEFWDMIDHPERAMPGAWDDRFDDSALPL